MSADNDPREAFSLPEQRFLQTLVLVGPGTWHVTRCETQRTSRWEGRWTRRYCDRRALCGAAPASVVGVDAAGWPKKLLPVEHPEWITCARCAERYDRWLNRGAA